MDKDKKGEFPFVVLGDSLVGDGDTKGAFTKALEDAGLTFRSVGRKGWTAAKFVSELNDSDAFWLDGAAVVVVLGTNDSTSTTPTAFADKLAQLAERLRGLGALDVIWATPTGFAPEWFAKAQKAVAVKGIKILRPSKRAQSSYSTSAMHPSVAQHKAFAGEVVFATKAVKWAGMASTAAKIAAGVGAAALGVWLIRR